MQSQNAIEYDYSVAKVFMFLAIVLGIVGMTIGVLIAFQLAFPQLNYLLGEYGTFSRLRPLHTDSVAYGFTLSGIWASWYYFGQRILKVSNAESKFLMVVSKLHLIVYVLVVAAVVVSLFMGITTSKEYAEFEWPIDIAVVVAWVLFGIHLFGMIGIRREKYLYISMWYMIAMFVAVAMLYLFNNMEIPTYFASG